jgi:Bacterial Ig-like domain (group 3)
MRGRDRTDGQLRTAGRAAALTAAVLALTLLGAASASAAIRYAAPGGNDEPLSECLQTNPCSLYNAASRFAPGSGLKAGDEVLLEPGTYSAAAGELGPDAAIISEAGVSIHGVAGQPRPVIELQGGNGGVAFQLDEPGQTLSRLEILASGGSGPWRTESSSSVVDGVVAISSGSVPCLALGGLVRNSVCLSTAPSAVALSALPGSGTHVTVELHNVTAIATGANSIGLRVAAEAAGDELNVNGVGVLARGTEPDVLGRATNSAKVTVTFSHSDFATRDEETDLGGTSAVTITEPGGGEANITADPLLAADGYHELAGSPTIDKGALDPSDPSLSGTTDVDGNARSIGAAPDIGADELQLTTTTSPSCAPSAAVGDTTPCTVTVPAPGGVPTGTVRFSSDGPGSFTGGGSRTLVRGGKDGAGSPACELSYTPGALGSGRHAITASYQGDAANAASQGSAVIGVLTKRQAGPTPL